MNQGVKVTGYFYSMKRLNMNELIKVLPDHSLVYEINPCPDGFPLVPADGELRDLSSETVLGLQVGVGLECQEDCDFSDIVLKYISQILMEENLEEKKYLEEQESDALLAAEQSLYEVIGKTHPTVLEHMHTQAVDRYVGESSSNPAAYDYSSCSSGSPAEFMEQGLNFEVTDYKHPGYAPVSESQSSVNNSTGSVGGRLAISPVSTLGYHHVVDESQSAGHFAKGVKETNNALPSNLFASYVYDEPLVNSSKDVMIKGEEKTGRGYMVEERNSLRSKKKSVHLNDDYMVEERNSKMSATYNETVLRSEMFDKVLLICGGEHESALREAFLNEAKKNDQLTIQAKGGKSQVKKSKSKREIVDLRTLLTLCAQAVAANDQRVSMDLLKQIRQHSSDKGDGMQRMAHYFANGLEARLAGSGTPFYKAFLHRHRSAADLLKAYQMYLAISPFRKISNFFANKTIMQVAENKMKLHIIDLGILFGFQWPCLIQRLSARPEGPPKIRITGIDFPQPGFKPADKVEETGRRLANYAESFDVPFEYNGIAKEWETITIEDLKLWDDDEVLVVNCMFNLRNILDESVKVDSPRNAVMKLIRKANPNIFIQGVVNGTYNAPFFISRFKESMYHYSSLFDMLETNIPRDIPERLLIEKEIFGRELMNVVACEGCERTERPETYKQWHMRNLRAGFIGLPLNEEIVRMAKERVKTSYHKDFLIGEDGNWLIQGWKGRITYGLSSWTPAAFI